MENLRWLIMTASLVMLNWNKMKKVRKQADFSVNLRTYQIETRGFSTEERNLEWISQERPP